MNYVEPIRDIKKIDKMKKLMRKENAIRELTLFELGIKTGLRISDILALKWIDVISDSTFKDAVSIIEKKTHKSKVFSLSKQLQAQLNELYSIEKPEIQDYIFRSHSNYVSSRKSAWCRQYAWQFLTDYGYRSGIKGRIGTHTLRKTFGYHAYKNGVDISLLMKLFNHSSQEITLRYIGITQDQLDDVYINMDKILSK